MESNPVDLSPEQAKRQVQVFYDDFGWLQTADGCYEDTQVWVDLRPVVAGYRHRALLRVRNYVRPRGHLFLDAGSGPVAHREYLTGSAGYDRRVCVDLSFTALIEARKRVGSHGLYVVADLTRLPFAPDTFDGALCADVLYHVPREEQHLALGDIMRVLRPRARAVIVYARSNGVTERLPELTIGNLYRLRDFLIRRSGARFLWRRTIKPLLHRRVSPGPELASPTTPPLYFWTHPPTWFRDNLPNVRRIEVVAGQTVGRRFTKRFIPENWLGAFALRALTWLEDTFPHAMARLSYYYLVAIEK